MGASNTNAGTFWVKGKDAAGNNVEMEWQGVTGNDKRSRVAVSQPIPTGAWKHYQNAPSQVNNYIIRYDVKINGLEVTAAQLAKWMQFVEGANQAQLEVEYYEANRTFKFNGTNTPVIGGVTLAQTLHKMRMSNFSAVELKEPEQKQEGFRIYATLTMENGSG